MAVWTRGASHAMPLMLAVKVMSSEADDIKSPAAVIRDRIEARRLYEARFLFRQLVGELTPANRKQLEQQLEESIHALEQKHRDAVFYAGQGDFGRARKLLEEIEQAAVDFPELDREKERLSPVDSILDSLNRGKGGYRPPGPGKNGSSSNSVQPRTPVAGSPPVRLPRKPPRVITVAILALPAVLAIILVFLLLRG